MSFVVRLSLFCLIFFLHLQLNAQEMPPRPVSLSIVRSLSFGAFTQSVGGGSIIVYPTGSRTSTGDLILVNFGYLFFPAIFELAGNPGTIIHFLSGPDAVLTGSQGGSMTVILGETEPISPFILPASPTGSMQVYVGGTLTVGNPLANPAGDYSGSFIVMFIQE